MEYEIFERDFIVRTLEIIKQYEKWVVPNTSESEQYEVTLLINCLLGLLVLPKERCYVNIPDKSIEELKGWGLESRFIKDWGRIRKNQHTLKELIHRMRNSVAHIRIKPHGNGTKITGLEFSDRNGFKAVVPVDCLRDFVIKLAESVEINNVNTN
jgi:hypothetical protein